MRGGRGDAVNRGFCVFNVPRRDKLSRGSDFIGQTDQKNAVVRKRLRMDTQGLTLGLWENTGCMNILKYSTAADHDYEEETETICRVVWTLDFYIGPVE